MLENYSIGTSDLKEAYDFAILLNVTDGISNVVVKPVNNSEYYIEFSKEPGGDLGKHILNIANVYELYGLNFREEYWSKLL